MKLLLGVNLENKQYNLKRTKIISHTALTAAIYNFRKFIYDLGYNSSLLNDSEIFALENLIFEAEQSEEGKSYLIEVLDFLSDK